MKMECKYVFYTHTDYADIMDVQIGMTKHIKNKYLLVNANNEEKYKDFEKVIIYNDELPYSQRLLTLLNQIDDEFILFMHDNDIFIEADDMILNKCIELMKLSNLDRVDFQIGGPMFKEHHTLIEIDECKKYYLSRNTNPNCYIYNVNPSIWRVSILKNILNTFSMHGYRDIENPEVQKYCVDNDFKIYKLMGDSSMYSTPFTILPFFQFIHITHKGKLLPIDDNRLDSKLKIDYANIVNTFKLIEGTREFYNSLVFYW
jgi:hypothetical protein